MTREEAIRIIEANCSCSESTLMEACAMFIPELRESYDERVRKNIVATIEQCPDDFLSPKNRDRMLAYLEKLKEQKPQEPQVFCEAKAYDLGYKQGKEDAKKEQKPKTFNEPYNPDEYEVIMERNATSLRRKEQKPAEWSEEEEKMRTNAVLSLQYLIEEFPNADFIDSVKKEKAWLESFRPQPQGVYKQIVHSIYKMLKGKDFYGMPTSNCISLLNDIRVKCKDADECAKILDVPSWKPSEEQMKAIESCFCEFGEGCPDEDGLRSLYNDLKKL